MCLKAESERFHPRLYSVNAQDSWGCPKPKPGAENSISVSPMGDRDDLKITCCLPACPGIGSQSQASNPGTLIKFPNPIVFKKTLE